MNDIKLNIIEKFNEFESLLNGQKDSILHSKRKTAFNHFINLGIPTPKNEEWKYTNLNFINKYNFNLSLEPSSKVYSIEEIKQFIYKDVKSNLFVFINGFFNKELSTQNKNEAGVIIGSLSEAIEQDSDIIQKYLGRYSKSENDAFTALNGAFVQDGIIIIVPKGVEFEEPIHLLYINDTREGSILSQPRNLIIAGECSKFKILETYHTIGTEPAMTNSLTEIAMKFSSQVDYYKVQNDITDSYYVGTTLVNQEKSSVFKSTTISLNGKFIRNNLNSVLNDENCESSFSGLYFLSENNFVDNHTVIEHAMPNCISNEIYKGILDDNSTAVFNGKILVNKDAQKTRSYQSNKNILLSDNAKINTKPQLEIFADDVKCSHGATSGSLDKESLFYLQARGISEKKAKSMLLNAFASDIIETISVNALRDEIKHQVAKRLDVEDIYFCDVLDFIKE